MKLNVRMGSQSALSAPPGLPTPPEVGQDSVWGIEHDLVPPSLVSDPFYMKASDSESETHADTSSRTADSDDDSDPELLHGTTPKAPVQQAVGAQMCADAPEFVPAQGTMLSNAAEVFVPSFVNLDVDNVRTGLRSGAPSFVPQHAWNKRLSLPFGAPPGLRPALRSEAANFVPRMGLMGCVDLQWANQ
mmetsp:Transcript_19954/g.38321  ORF Transcript_19954/g.38321 Transcript_19954/m.38321 type:complete len:189 (+) Transcript_19954:43-609(+)